ncbi:hypothetical protein DENIS_3189 [Desulfonema ishimotonii]|uniref:Class I SAM-dependent methyltransferase n=2 Tax=Desulfonema ishimotonii TaxID=45657 RepID=A0A401FZ41_9BACT|nr:hypothetical protein DENIS_3189 [Desulfonema ishimotonii]
MFMPENSEKNTDSVPRIPPMPESLACGVIPEWNLTELVHRGCPVCNEDCPIPVCLRPDRLAIHRCAGCGMIYLADIPGKNDLDMLYRVYGEYKGYISSSRRTTVYSFLKKLRLCRENFFIRILDDFDGISEMRLCEIGASYGDFLQLARFRGATVSAVELDDAAVSHLQETLKIPAYHIAGELPDMQDIICARSVFEHIPSPGTVLREISEKLAGDGRLLLSVPNGANLDTIGPAWAGFRVDMEHLNYWTPRTFAQLLARYGFYVEQYWELNQLATARNRSVPTFFSRILKKGTWMPGRDGRATLAVLARPV